MIHPEVDYNKPPTLDQYLAKSAMLWAPHVMFPRLQLQCPGCNRELHKKEWVKPRLVHARPRALVLWGYRYK